MTRGKVVKLRRKTEGNAVGEPFAYVLFDAATIIALICAACVTKDDDTTVGIFEKGTIVCDRCGETA